MGIGRGGTNKEATDGVKSASDKHRQKGEKENSRDGKMEGT